MLIPAKLYIMATVCNRCYQSNEGLVL